MNRGKNYFSLPEIKIEATGITTTGVYGSGAILKPVVDTSGKLQEVKVINSGIGYTGSQVSLSVKSRGLNAIFEPRVRKLTIDNNFRHGNHSLSSEDNDLHLSCSWIFFRYCW